MERMIKGFVVVGIIAIGFLLTGQSFGAPQAVDEPDASSLQTYNRSNGGIQVQSGREKPYCATPGGGHNYCPGPPPVCNPQGLWADMWTNRGGYGLNVSGGSYGTGEIIHLFYRSNSVGFYRVTARHSNGAQVYFNQGTLSFNGQASFSAGFQPGSIVVVFEMWAEVST